MNKVVHNTGTWRTDGQTE